jgi:hypothetical protein
MMKKISLSILFVFIFFILVGQVNLVRASNTWFVSPDGTGNDCTQSNPCQIDVAVQTKSSPGDTIYVKEGIYRDPGTAQPYITYIHKSLTLIGSCTFEATGPVSCVTRNMSSFLDGETERRVVVIQGVPDTGMSVRISGFTLMRGNGESNPIGDCDSFSGETVLGCGGGIFAEGVDNLELNHTDNWSNEGSRSATSTDTSRGGGLYAETVGTLVLTNNVFRFNKAANQGYGYGGGAFITGSGHIDGVLLQGNLFDGNSLSSNIMHTVGGGLFVQSSEGLQINQNEFVYQNFTLEEDIYGSAIYLTAIPLSYIYNNIFHDNYGLSSIRIDCPFGQENEVVINRNKIIQESTVVNIEIHDGANVMVINNFIGASAVTPSIGVWSRGDQLRGIPEVFIGLNTFALHSYGIFAYSDSDIFVDKNIFTQISNIAIHNNEDSTSVFTITENLFHDNTDNGLTGSTVFTGDPLLVDPTNGDFHIQAGSAAIDKVDLWQGGIDIDGQIRGIGIGENKYDVGADEYVVENFLPIILK